VRLVRGQQAQMLVDLFSAGNPFVFNNVGQPDKCQPGDDIGAVDEPVDVEIAELLRLFPCAAATRDVDIAHIVNDAAYEQRAGVQARSRTLISTSTLSRHVPAGSAGRFAKLTCSSGISDSSPVSTL